MHKLTIQYDGTDYVGWQRQASGTSIQGLIETALEPIEGRTVSVQGAGRTDAGVHAVAQVASVALETALDHQALRRALNAVLPPDVRVTHVERAADDFHARFSAREKTYEYRIVNGPFVSPFEYRYAWHLPYPLEVSAMHEAALVLVGKHDFSAFQATGSDVKSAERTVIGLDVEFDEPHVAITVTADGFLRHMVRTIAGTLVDVGSGRATARSVAEALASGQRGRMGPTAPARGLFLLSVGY
jgi:tRNA pseudouridine38-40 synthase